MTFIETEETSEEHQEYLKSITLKPREWLKEIEGENGITR